jgi:uncharacterized repeat protein (TIGR01451 family)
VTASDQNDPDSAPNNDDGDQSEDDEDFATATPAGAVLVPAIDIEKSVSPSIASPGTLVTFTLTITNTGQVPFDPVELVDILSPGLTYANAATIPPDTVVVNPDGTTTITWLNIGPMNPGDTITITFMALFNGEESSSRNIATATGTDPFGLPFTDSDTAAIMQLPSTPDQPDISLQPMAYNRMVECFDEFRDLVARLREAHPDIEWRRKVPCCESLEELVEQLIKLVLDKGLDSVYPEKWARIQELIPYVEVCCGNVSQYYEAENYEASNYWSIQRNEAYREIIELLLEMLGL